MEKAELAYADYKKGTKYKDIATKYDVSLNTVKSWKQRRWNDIEKGVHTKEKSMHTKCTQKQKGNAPPKIELLPEELETLANEELTEKQRLFCLYYVKYRNKVKAYQKAYDCSYTNACGHAAELYKKVEIQQTIAELLKDMRNEIKLEAKDIILKKMQIAFADITDFVSFGMRTDENTGVKYSYVDFKESADIDGTIVHEVRKGKDGISIKLYDGQKELDWLYEHLIIDDEKREKIKLLKAQLSETQARTEKMAGTKEENQQISKVDQILKEMQEDAERKAS